MTAMGTTCCEPFFLIAMNFTRGILKWNAPEVFSKRETARYFHESLRIANSSKENKKKSYATCYPASCGQTLWNTVPKSVLRCQGKNLHRSCVLSNHCSASATFRMFAKLLIVNKYLHNLMHQMKKAASGENVCDGKVVPFSDKWSCARSPKAFWWTLQQWNCSNCLLPAENY